VRTPGADGALRDLEERTLANIPGEMARLVYLASTRDYNTGQYQHEGLARMYSVDAAQQALRRCHENTFRALAFAGLEELAAEIDGYARSSGSPEQVIDAWRRLEAYRVLVPAGSEALAGQLFVSNVRIALEILRPAPRRNG
jgi:hypothetical protein